MNRWGNFTDSGCEIRHVEIGSLKQFKRENRITLLIAVFSRWSVGVGCVLQLENIQDKVRKNLSKSAGKRFSCAGRERHERIALSAVNKVTYAK